MSAALHVEFVKLVRRPVLWWSSAAAAAMAIAFGYLIPYLVGPRSKEQPSSGQPPSDERGYSVPLELLLPERFVENAISGFPLFYLALALVLGALSSGSEYQWQTVRSMVLWGPGRSTMLMAKSAVLIVLVVVLAVAAFVASGISSVVIALIEGESMSLPPLGDIVLGLGAAWLILAVGAGLGLIGGVIARSGGAVIGGGLVYLFVVELLLRNFATSSNLVEAIAKVLPGTNAGSLAGSFADGTDGAPGVNDLVGVPWATVMLFAWIVVAVAGAVVVFARRDISA